MSSDVQRNAGNLLSGRFPDRRRVVANEVLDRFDVVIRRCLDLLHALGVVQREIIDDVIQTSFMTDDSGCSSAYLGSSARHCSQRTSTRTR